MSTETVTLKLVVEHAQKATGDVHVVVLARPPTYAALQTAARQALDAAEVKLRYIDDEGDRIVLASQVDLNTALTLAAPGARLRVLAEVVSPLPQEPQQTRVPAETTPLETLLEQLGGASELGTVLCGMLGHLAQHEAAERPEEPKKDAAADGGTQMSPCEEAGVYGQVAHTLPTTVVHRGMCCDGCGASPIRGMRYKCACCADYDLCQECVRNARARHDAHHVFVPLALPTGGVQVMPLMRLMRAAVAAAAEGSKEEEVKMTPAEQEAVKRLEEMGFTDVRRNLAYLRRFNGTICEQLVECLARLTAEDCK